ncbi:MAG: MFS transporter [Deltaproteobacteria bacterium]|nr:MFS transporter [Deltaproteobacteria bacterium]MBN2671264.1 MFS transporter [Deltaproteobacteria bacterium]
MNSHESNSELSEGRLSTKAQRFSWCLFDFANSAFPTVIITAIYVIYFKDVVVGSERVGESDKLWGMANSIGAAIVFLTAPLLGAIADFSGKKKLFLIVFSVLCIVATSLLAFTGSGTVSLAVGAFIVALVGFEGACVFYNAFLPSLVPKHEMERLSGAGWALGYLGGLGCLLLCLPIALGKTYLHLIPAVVAIWFALFAIPAFVYLKDRAPTHAVSAGQAIRQGASRFISTVLEIGKYKNLVKFLAAFFFYNNAVATIIVFAVAFSKDSLAFTTAQNITLIIIMNIVAAPGAYAFGWVAKRIGAKRTIVITLSMWLAVVAGAEAAAWPGLFSKSGAQNCFWGVAVLASLCIGAIQATSRTFVGQLAPEGRSGEFFGFMAFAGKGSAIVGPLVFGVVSSTFDSQRLAVASIGFFFLIGLMMMGFVRTAETRARDAA